MKRILVSLALVLALAVPASAARLLWNASVCTAAAGNCPTEYTVYYKDTAVPATEYRKTVPATQTALDLVEARLEPGKTYQFAVAASNPAGQSGRTPTVNYTPTAYTPGIDILPPVVIVIPGAATTIRIDP